jgi:hypothetical protein
MLRVLFEVAEDETRDPRIRVAAISEIADYATPSAGVSTAYAEAYRESQARAARPRPVPQATLPSVGADGLSITVVAIPGDSLRTRREMIVDHPNYSRSGSIDPVLRDTIRARLARIARTTGDPALRDVAVEALEEAGGFGGPGCAERIGTVSGTCDDPVDGLVSAWSVATGDSARLGALLWDSQRLSDRRLIPMLERVARDPGRPAAQREAAMSVLATLANPIMNTLRQRSEPGARCINWGWHTHPAIQLPGREPITSEDRRSISRTLRDLSRLPGGGSLVWQARFLANCLTTVAVEHPFPK